MDEEAAYRIASQLAAALEALHTAGVAHRHLSPEAIYFTDGASGMLKLGSLHSAEVDGADTANAPRGLVPGVPAYRAPEAWQPGPFAGAPVDMWAFGAIVYELLHARTAFDGDSLPLLSLQIRRLNHREVAPSLSSAATALIKACLVREPMLRAGPRQMSHLHLNAWNKSVLAA